MIRVELHFPPICSNLVGWEGGDIKKDKMMCCVVLTVVAAVQSCWGDTTTVGPRLGPHPCPGPSQPPDTTQSVRAMLGSNNVSVSPHRSGLGWSPQSASGTREHLGWSRQARCESKNSWDVYRGLPPLSPTFLETYKPSAWGICSNHLDRGLMSAAGKWRWNK